MIDVVFLPGADADYRDALAWYQKRSPQAAAGFESAIEVALRQIAQTPERSARCDDQHRLYLLRKYPYSLIYRVEPAAVLVVAAAHSKRSGDYWRNRE